MTATDPLPASLPAKIPADFRSSNDQGRLFWYHGGSITVDDADHLRLSDVHPFHRISTRQVPDLPCDEHNPAHVTGKDAYLRGQAYSFMNDLATANCWWHVGAVEGNSDAQSRYAYSLLKGRGIPQNVDEARLWAQKSADQHNPFGEINLVMIMNLNVAVALGVGSDEADELKHRIALHDPDAAYTGDPTAPPEPAMPVFEHDKTFTYDLRGEWRVTYPPEAPRHPVFTVVVLQKDQDFQLIVGDPNIYYLGHRMPGALNAVSVFNFCHNSTSLFGAAGFFLVLVPSSPSDGQL